MDWSEACYSQGNYY